MEKKCHKRGKCSKVVGKEKEEKGDKRRKMGKGS